MKTPDQTDNPLLNELDNQNQRITELEVLENEHKQTEKELRESEEKLKIILESVQTGIVIIDSETHRIVDANRFVSQLIGVPKERIIGSTCHQYICPAEEGRCPITDLGQTVDNAERVLLTAGGRRCPVIKTVEPVMLRGRKHLLESFVDITERKRTEEALRESENAAQRLAQENSVMAEIGRIIGSTPNVEEVYERFADEVHRLIQFDCIAVSIINPQENTFSIPYITGRDMRGREQGKVIPLTGSGTERVRESRSSLLILEHNREEMMGQLPKLRPVFDTGIRSMMLIPLVSKGQVIGVLHLYKATKDAYTQADLKLAERVGTQIAGAIANAQLFLERARAEETLQENQEAAQQLSEENAVMAEIGRIISSTLNIDEIYESFSKEAKKLTSFDRILISIIDTEEGTVRNVYIAGERVPDRNTEEVYPLEGSGNAEMVRTKSTFLVQAEDLDECKGRFPMLRSTFEAGFRSIMNVPLFSKGKIIGGLLLRSRTPRAYTERDVRLAERIASQIAGAIANAELFTQLRRAEGALRESEKAARGLAQETAVIAQIGHIISSTLDIDVVYERFAEEAKKLLDFDRITVNIIDQKENRIIVPYVWGTTMMGRHSGDIIPLSGSLTEELLKARSSLLVNTENEKEIAARFPVYIPIMQVGLRSSLFIPLIVQDEVIGSLSFFSKKSNAYTDRDLKLAESIGYQIAGAIANAQLFLELAAGEATVAAEKKKAEELEALNQQLRASEQQLRTSEEQLKAANQQLEAKEQALQKSQTQLMGKLAEVERFNKVMVGRELKMIDLKQEINSLLGEMGKPKKY